MLLYSSWASIEGKECARPSSTVGIEFSRVGVDWTIGTMVEFTREFEVVAPFKLGWFSLLFPTIFGIKSVITTQNPHILYTNSH